MRQRFRAFVIHLLGSAALAVVALVLVYRVWYPSPLDAAVGVTEIFLTVLAVDVTIGPLLTFVVYKPGKKTLFFDLTVIVLLQLAAFGYGTWTVAEGRPVWLVFSVDRFDIVRANEVDMRQIGKARPEYRDPPWFGPQWAAARRPDDAEERNKIMFESIFSGVDFAQRPELYRPLSEEVESIRKAAKPIEELARYNSAEAVAAVRQQWPSADTYLPMMARAQEVTVLIRKETTEVVAIVGLKPWD